MSMLTQRSETEHQNNYSARATISQVATAEVTGAGHPAEPYVYIPLSSINVLLSIFSAAFFLVKDKAVHPVLRRLVVTMSLFEIIFHAAVIITYSIAVSQQSVPSASLEVDSTHPMLLLLRTVLRFSLTMRNWTMGFISWSRVEAVFNPLSSRSGTIFKAAYFAAMETVAAVIGLCLSLLMVSAQDAGLSMRLWSESQIHAIEIVFYTYQGVIPIVSILIATMVTVIVLRKASILRRRLHSSQLDENRSHLLTGRTQAKPTGIISHSRARSRSPSQSLSFDSASKRQSRRERQSIRLIVGLSLTCLVLESPTDLFGFIKNKAPLTELLVNTLVELDSLCNFFIYTCTTSMLRQIMCSRWRGAASAAGSTGPSSYQRSPQRHSAPATVASAYRKGSALKRGSSFQISASSTSSRTMNALAMAYYK